MQSAAIEADPRAAGLYVLDMGEPVRILDLAERFIRAHGLRPRIVEAGGDEDASSESLPTVDVILSGARPGEKLDEELAYASEDLQPTGFDRINAWPGALPDDADIPSMIEDLTKAVAGGEPSGVLEAIRRHVPQLRAGAL
jgi:O-antigen biosynthesis protein WbqV